MSVKARARFESTFDLDLMVESYRQLIVQVAPPVVLLDMDGTLVDWDKGFRSIWQERCEIDRTASYFMEDCISDAYMRKDALQCCAARGFFEALEPMPGALEAVREMQAEGLQLYICTSPVKHSRYCAQEKLNWVAEHLGEEWLDRTILCQDKVN
jgi:5'-nucleotidase